MKFVKPSVEWLPQEPTLDGAKKLIEIAGRTCYKSEHLITKDSSDKFYNRMLSYGHGSVLEHGTVYLKLNVLLHPLKTLFYKLNPFSKVKFKGINAHVTTNLRVIEKNRRVKDLSYFKFTDIHEKRYTFRIITSRIISQQYTRHRVMSPSQESQRYCNYSKGKFNNEVQFIYPVWFSDCSKEAAETYKEHLIATEKAYFKLTDEGLPAEDARDVLNNGVKTEFVYTGFASDFLGNFHELRSHRSAQELIRIQEEEIFNIINNNK